MQRAFERALGEVLARVFVCAPDSPRRLGVALSGGLDSTVLLHLASRYAAEHGVVLHAFHVHHGLSPNADAWEAHCRREAQRCGIAFASRRVEVDRNDKRGVEEAARIARYAALGDMCRASGVGLLLAAHHRDDQAETVLLQLMRGAGLPGLSGMAACQLQHELLGEGVALGRPLLGIARAQLEIASRSASLIHVSDESNTDTRYRRNALRHEISPLIETHFPGFGALVARSASHAQSAQGLLHELAMIDLETCKADALGATLQLSALRQLSNDRADNLLRHWLYRQGVKLPSTSRLDEIRGQMLDAQADTHPFFDFGDMSLHRIGMRLELHPRAGASPEEPIGLRWAGEPEIAVPQWRGRMLFEMTPGAGLDPTALRGAALTLCARRGQERLKLADNRPSKSLKSLFQEASVAAWQRKWLPLLYLDDHLVFAAGLGMDVRHFRTMPGVVLRWIPD
ncbi:MAG: tilS [Herminiimonas sp.]|nr:tilS [Herminiimonas sp.]